MKLILVLALLAVAAVAQNTCRRPIGGNVFKGKYPLSGERSPVLHPETRPWGWRDYPWSWDVEFDFTTDGFVRETATNGSHTVGFTSTWDINNLYCEINYESVQSVVLSQEQPYSRPVPTTDLACTTQPGRYRIHWNDWCTKITFELFDDHCFARRVKFNGLVITRQGYTCHDINFPRHTRREQCWSATYPKNAGNSDLRGLPVQFVIRPGTSERDVLEQSARGTRRSNWRFTNNHLHVYDVSSRPKWMHCTDYGNDGIYLITWYDNCRRFILNYVTDSCNARRELYQDLDVVFLPTAIPSSTNSGALIVPSILAIASALFFFM